MKVKIQYKDHYKELNINRRKAIREKCLNCTAWSFSQVASCSFPDCNLFAFRMGKGKQNAKARAISIRKYCRWCVCGGSSKQVKACGVFDCPLYVYRNTTIDRTVDFKKSYDSLKEKFAESERKSHGEVIVPEQVPETPELPIGTPKITYKNPDTIKIDAWKKLSNYIKKRDCYRCAHCGKRVIKGLTVHHIKPRVKGGESNEKNLITLCNRCHDYIELNDIIKWNKIVKYKTKGNMQRRHV